MLSSRITRHASRISAVGALLLTTAGIAADRPFEPGRDGWLTLFDGSDLSRWKVSKSADWALKDALLTATKGEIVNYWQWADFELTALCRGEGEIRCRYSTIPDPAQPGYWLDVTDGTLRADGGRVVAKGTGAKTDGWREVSLVVSKGVFTVSLDGKHVAEGKDTACPHKGAICLVAKGRPFEVKLLRARPLNREKHANVPSPDSACFVCHANFEGEKIAKKHADSKADKLAREEDEEHLRPPKDRPKKAGCAGCHGPCFDHRSDEDNVTPPDVMYTRGEVKAACLQCHIPHKTETKRKDGNGPPPPNPVCTDCHGSHTVKN
ncbi:MAG TPA: DUF1080 domain-containing protein [Planctomycetota bacterium]|nr:DUF1080 domain-containing protein [Planctomycetota bacterium]HRR82640.1 DUF1080 domain-containing protein [Planctomycetota bacterium]HRT96017.1 DUF1080 domain-containing protein [Planctomycetota bacterium]